MGRHLNVAFYQANMDQFFQQEGLSIIGVPTENQIRAYATSVTLGLAKLSISKNRTPDKPRSLKQNVAILLAGIQCVHMLYRYAYYGEDTSKGKLGERKGIVIQNVCSDLMETDFDSPSDEALGAMSAAAVLYNELSARDDHLLRKVDDAWKQMFQERNGENANAIISCMNDLVRYQSSA